MSGCKHVWEQGRYKGTCRACNSVGELNVMLSAKIAEQAAELKELQQSKDDAVREAVAIITAQAAEIERLRRELEDAAEGFESASLGHGIDFAAYARYARVALEVDRP